MPKPKSVETYHEGGQWKNKVTGNTKASNTAATKKDAVSKGKAQAKDLGAEHVIKNKDGKISQKNSYGNDPNPPKDKK
ncbi:DUF2188 domain-containing protein [Glycomyces tritici]|uniref:DUF2188 domain-containing protein n=1 Tax=Glycomyces tritici TaxID=2665176 RepID=A0ABT7YQV1_9ACTN|nr:DUF2188 domain-containing protein [Glycomyces tritici]MDN3240995.1 DUF2188 domain-containing protein [Glycomyces tritici]